MASAALGAVTVGLRLPFNHHYKVPGVKKTVSEVVAGGLSVDALGYLIGTSEEPFPVEDDLSQGAGLSQELPDVSSNYDVSFDTNVLRAEVSAVPIGQHPKPKRFMPPTEWPGKVWKVLNKFQAHQDAVQWEYQTTMLTQKSDAKVKRASASTTQPPKDGLLDSTEGLGEISDTWGWVNASDTKFSPMLSNRGPSPDTSTKVAKPLFPREDSFEESMAAELSMVEVHHTMDEVTSKQESLSMARSTPPPTMPTSCRHLISPSGYRLGSPSQASNISTTATRRSQSSCSHRGIKPATLRDTKLSKAALDYALRLSVYQEHLERAGPPGETSFRYLRGQDIDDRIRTVEAEVAIWQSQGVVPLPGSVQTQDEPWSPRPRSQSQTYSQYKSKPKPKSIWSQVPVARTNKRMAFKEWLKREDLKQHLDDMKKAGSDRALTGNLWLHNLTNQRMAGAGIGLATEAATDNDWVKVQVCFDLHSFELLWSKPQENLKDEEKWARAQLHEQAFEYTPLPAVKQKKRTLFAFQITKPMIVSHNHKKDLHHSHSNTTSGSMSHHRMALSGPSVTLATETMEERQQWLEALKHCREGVRAPLRQTAGKAKEPPRMTTISQFAQQAKKP